MRHIASHSWNGTGDTRSCRGMSASLLNATYVADPIRALNGNPRIRAPVSRCGSNLMFGSGLAATVMGDNISGPPEAFRLDVWRPEKDSAANGDQVTIS